MKSKINLKNNIYRKISLSVCLIFISIFNNYSQSIYLRDFIKRDDLRNIDFKKAEKYLDYALDEVLKSEVDYGFLIPRIAREYYRIGNIEKGNKCKNYLQSKYEKEFVFAMNKGKISFMNPDSLVVFSDSVNTVGKILIVERLVSENLIDDAIYIFNKNKNDEKFKKEFFSEFCLRIDNILLIKDYYEIIKIADPDKLYLTLATRIRNNKINPKDAIKLLNDLNLINNRSITVLSYAIRDVNEIDYGFELIEQYIDSNKNEVLKSFFGDYSFTKSFPIYQKKHIKIACSIEHPGADYICFKLNLFNDNNIKINNELKVSIKKYDEFLFDHELFYFLINNNQTNLAKELINYLVNSGNTDINLSTKYEKLIIKLIDLGIYEQAEELIKTISKYDFYTECVITAIQQSLIQNKIDFANKIYSIYLKDEFFKNEIKSDFLYYYIRNDIQKKLDEYVDTASSQERISFYLLSARYYIGIKWTAYE